MEMSGTEQAHGLLVVSAGCRQIAVLAVSNVRLGESAVILECFSAKFPCQVCDGNSQIEGPLEFVKF